MNDLMKQAVAATGTQGAAIFAMLVFIAIFMGGLAAAVRAPSTPPEME